MMERNLWTVEQESLARRLLDERASNDEFLAKIGRTRAAAQTRMRYLKVGRANRDRKRKLGPRVVLPPSSAASGIHIGRPKSIPQDVLDDAFRRNSAERTITALFCGDPAPGQSALDRRNAGVPA
jgi:hypothetical protein